MPLPTAADTTATIHWGGRRRSIVLRVTRPSPACDGTLEVVASHGAYGPELLPEPADVLALAATYAYVPAELGDLLRDDRRLHPIYVAFLQDLDPFVDALDDMYGLTELLTRYAPHGPDISDTDRASMISSARARYLSQHTDKTLRVRQGLECRSCGRTIAPLVSPAPWLVNATRCQCPRPGGPGYASRPAEK